ncbi:hypothetical protein CIPAW_08G119700 [Carya illinoinensis]|uniref:Uncharacterized protein n=1 Tax=Carya illinoinensis TaxID=32201 RepID=A0A8T1PVL0_CARIL|nr:hypothetical protein CIPAW_08G119700 [Carya illinoinensis]
MHAGPTLVETHKQKHFYGIKTVMGSVDAKGRG